MRITRSCQRWEVRPFRTIPYDYSASRDSNHVGVHSSQSVRCQSTRFPSIVSDVSRPLPIYRTIAVHIIRRNLDPTSAVRLSSDEAVQVNPQMSFCHDTTAIARRLSSFLHFSHRLVTLRCRPKPQSWWRYHCHHLSSSLDHASNPRKQQRSKHDPSASNH